MKNYDDEVAKFEELGLRRVKKNLAENIYSGQKNNLLKHRWKRKSD